MAAIGAYIAAQILNVTLKQTGSLVSPATLGLALCVAAPTSVSISEIGSNSGYTPQTITFNSAAANATSVSNAATLLFGPFSSRQSISGFVVKDTLALGGAAGNVGNIIVRGVMGAPFCCSVGDYISIAVGALKISIS